MEFYQYLCLIIQSDTCGEICKLPTVIVKYNDVYN